MPRRGDLLSLGPALAWLASRAFVVAVLAHLVPYAAQTDGAADVEHIYLPWARQIAAGLVPYRDFPIEYPPLAVPFLVLPTGSPARALSAFVAVALVVDALVLGLLLWTAAGPAVWTWAVAAALLGPVWLTRLDLPVALVIVAAWAAWRSQRWGLLGALVVAGGLLKLWPVLLLPLAFMHPATDRRRLVFGALGSTATAGAVLVSLGWWPGVLSVLRYHLDRGLELEAVAAAVPAALGARRQHRFGAAEVVGPGVGALLALTTLVGVVAVVLLLRAARRGAAPGVLVAGLAVAVLATAKVCSAQYLVWGTAAVCCLLGAGAVRPRPLVVPLGALLLVAQACYPVFWREAVHGGMVGNYLLVLRAGLVVVLVAEVVRAATGRSDTGPAEDGQPSAAAPRSGSGRLASRTGT